MKQWLKDFTHNCIVHPLMMFIPKKYAHPLHDRNADWCWGKENHVDELTLLDVQFECHSYAVNREFDSVGNSLYFVYRKGLPKGEHTKLTSVATYSNIDSALIYCL